MNHVLPRQRTPGRRCPPPSDVRLILVANANRLTIEWRVSVAGEMEHELVAVVEEPSAVDRLVVADRQVVVEPGPAARQRLFDRDRLDPVNGVLELEMRPSSLRDVHRRPRIGRLGAHVQEQRSVRGQGARGALAPIHRSTPGTVARHGVVVGAVLDAEVVRRRRDDRVDRAGGKALEHIETVAKIKTKGGTAGR